MQRPPYEKEVLGRRVAIKFEAEVEHGKQRKKRLEMRFYDGTVRGFKIEMGKIKVAYPASAPLVVQHFIVFDDGDEDWHDLSKLEGFKLLRWLKHDLRQRREPEDTKPKSADSKPAAKRKQRQLLEGSDAKPAAKRKRHQLEDPDTKPAAKRKGPQVAPVTKPAAKRKGRQLEDTKDKGAGDRKSPRAAVTPTAAAVGSFVLPPDPFRIPFARRGGASNSLAVPEQREDASSSTESVDDVPPATHTASQSIVPKVEDLVKVDPVPSDEQRIASSDQEILLLDPPPGEWPTSITAIIRYMDVLEPGKHYHQRQQDSRGECSRTRVKLRKFGRSHPDHPAISFWIRTGSWTPPDEAALGATIRLLKTMIK